VSRPRKRRTGCFTLLLLAAIIAALAFAWFRYDTFADAPMRGVQPGPSVGVRPGHSPPTVPATRHPARRQPPQDPERQD